MKKTLLSIAFLSIFAGSAVAQENENKDANEDILNNVLQQLMTKQDKKPEELIKNKQDNIKKNPVVQNEVVLKNENKDNTNKAPVVSENKNKLTEIVEQPKMQLVEESIINNEVDKVLSTGMIIEDINTSERELNTEETPEHVFLLNVPIETKIRANIDLILPPYRDKISYYEGNVTSGSPFEYTSKATFCYLNLEKSGLWRRFKSDENKYLKLVSNVSNKKVYNYNIDDTSKEVITVYETVFTFDNPHIKNLVCETSEKELPLTIGDLNKATGNLFNFEITPMLDI
tara:strand:+ start:364 stop:1224 length:861 start_codon:yes stop_codon:yes gene_type:complete